ncbi:MAG: hypothetical protein ABIT10_00675 [Alteraurantiacibacter sp.]
MIATILKDPIGWWTSLGRPFTRLPRWGAIAALLVIVMSLGWMYHATSQLDVTEKARVAARSKDSIGDVELYRRIVRRVREGESFYVASLDEQRHHNYPTRPFVTVRPPTLAYITAAIGAPAGKVVSGGLFIVCLALWLWRLEQAGVSIVERGLAMGAMAVFGISLFRDSAMLFHEVFAGLLLAIALALIKPDGKWWPVLLIAALALAIRELVLPFVLLWAVFAAYDRNWRGVAAALGVVALFGAGMVLHAQAVAPHVLPTDLDSPGWDAFNGPRLPFYAMAKLTAFVMIKPWIAAPLAMLPLVGWLALGGRLGLFASLWFLGYFLMLALFARTNNNYWVLLVLPAYAIGFALLPRGLWELVTVAVKGRKSLS